MTDPKHPVGYTPMTNVEWYEHWQSEDKTRIMEVRHVIDDMSWNTERRAEQAVLARIEAQGLVIVPKADELQTALSALHSRLLEAAKESK